MPNELVGVLPAAAVAPGPLVGHSSGATGLDVLAPHEAFALHPLMTVTTAGAVFAGAGAAIAGSTSRALALAARLSEAVGMRPVRVDEPDRAIYHAAASVASNFLVTLEGAAETLAGSAGIDRELLLPLVRFRVGLLTEAAGDDVDRAHPGTFRLAENIEDEMARHDDDRLVHTAEIVAIDGDSDRLKEARERTEQRARQRRGGKT